MTIYTALTHFVFPSITGASTVSNSSLQRSGLSQFTTMTTWSWWGFLWWKVWRVTKEKLFCSSCGKFLVKRNTLFFFFFPLRVTESSSENSWRRTCGFVLCLFVRFWSWVSTESTGGISREEIKKARDFWCLKDEAPQEAKSSSIPYSRPVNAVFRLFIFKNLWIVQAVSDWKPLLA